MYIVICILLFGFLIAIHEFGHFIVAKACGIKVNEFSIGMGPLLLHKQGKETVYSLRLLPIGGYCAMEGEDEDTGDERAFRRAPAWKRLLVLIAGSGFNFLAGLVIVLALYAGMTTTSEPVIQGFMDGFPLAGEEGLMEGDRILAINGRRVLLTGDISTLLSLANSETVDVTILREGRELVQEDLPLTLREYEVDGQTVQRYGLYFSTHAATWGDRLYTGLCTAVNFVRTVFWSLEMLFNGSATMNDLTGPVGIVQTMNQVGEASPNWVAAAENLLYFSAFIAVNLAVMNLLPLPALDGGRVFFLLLSGVSWLLFRRTIPEKLEGAVHFAGLILLLALMVLVAINDVNKIIA